MSDAKYYSLVAANEALMSEIEPASASGAEALAEVVTAALRMQYEPVEDEISLAGMQTIALSQSMTLYCFITGAEDLALH